MFKAPNKISIKTLFEDFKNEVRYFIKKDDHGAIQTYSVCRLTKIKDVRDERGEFDHIGIYWKCVEETRSIARDDTEITYDPKGMDFFRFDDGKYGDALIRLNNFLASITPLTKEGFELQVSEMKRKFNNKLEDSIWKNE